MVPRRANDAGEVLERNIVFYIAVGQKAVHLGKLGAEGASSRSSHTCNMSISDVTTATDREQLQSGTRLIADLQVTRRQTVGVPFTPFGPVIHKWKSSLRRKMSVVEFTMRPVWTWSVFPLTWA